MFGDRPDGTGEIDYVKEELPDGRVRWVSTAGLSAPGCPPAGCSSAPDRNRFGTLPRNTVFAPGYWTFDAALLKNFNLGSSRYVQFRFEAYNLFNHSRLNNPDLNFQINSLGVPNPDQNFGIINGRTGNRLVQLGLKLHF